MPLYEYRCNDCGTEYEKLLKINTPDPACPDCDSEKIKRLVSTSTFHLRGSGWTPKSHSTPTRSRKVNTASLPFVTPSGGLSAADGTPMLNSDGSGA